MRVSTPVPLDCSPLPPYAGALPCVGAPCRVISSTVFPHVGCGNGTPNVVVGSDGEPEVLYESSYYDQMESWLARRRAGAWTTTATPPFTNAAFVLGAGGCGYAWLANGFAPPGTGVGLYAIDGDGFSLLRSQDDDLKADATQLVMDPTGSLHMMGLVYPRMQPATIDVTRSGWVEGAGARFGWPATLAVGPDGSTHYLWRDGQQPDEGFYVHGGTLISLGLPDDGGDGAYENADWAMAVAGTMGAGRPRILLDAWDSGALYFAWRDDNTSPFHMERVTAPAAPIGLAAAPGGDAVGIATNGTLNHRSGLFAVTFHDGTITTQDLGVDVHPYKGSSTVGPHGHLHIAVCADGDQVHYYEVAPGTAP